jgi:hypothetical protein
MTFKFVTDRIINGKAFPTGARHLATPYTASWCKFVDHWPRTVPFELLEHCGIHNFPYTLNTTTQLSDHNNFYIVGLGFFDFEIDYFALLPQSRLTELSSLNFKVLFYYHEGDNPYRIKRRLDQLCTQHNLSTDCYVFVSGNTIADNIKNFVWFPDHELLYWNRNNACAPMQIHDQVRERDFVVLSRAHKWWRATCITDLLKNNLLNNSYWSYATDITTDHYIDNPIQVEVLGLESDLHEFIAGSPYVCDTLTSTQHNDHSLIVPEHFLNSYCSIILETHFDADQSGGAFLTEKTFKCLKHGHPFIIVGAAGSLAALRALGYQTFDSEIDNSYDAITDNTQRWLAIKKTIAQLKSQNLHTWFQRCRPDIIHNQLLFCSSKYNRLNSLLERIK